MFVSREASNASANVYAKAAGSCACRPHESKQREAYGAIGVSLRTASRRTWAMAVPPAGKENMKVNGSQGRGPLPCHLHKEASARS